MDMDVGEFKGPIDGFLEKGEDVESAGPWVTVVFVSSLSDGQVVFDVCNEDELRLSSDMDDGNGSCTLSFVVDVLAVVAV